MDKCFYEPCEGGYRATVWTRGPWDARAQHGGPPTALLTTAYTVLGNRFGIDHATIQIEPEEFSGESQRSLCNGGCDTSLDAAPDADAAPSKAETKATSSARSLSTGKPNTRP